MREIGFFKLHASAIIPTRAYSTDAGLDLYSLENVFIPINDKKIIKTGIGIDLPPDFYAKIEDRSSMGAKGLRTGGGVIDAGFQGELGVIIHNLNCSLHLGISPNFSGKYEGPPIPYGYWIQAGDKVAQLIIQRIETPTPKEIPKPKSSERSSNGFGSSGT